MQAFNAKIIEAKTKGGAYIEIPFNVEEVYGAKRVKVIASFDGVQYRGSLEKMGTDCHIIGIKKEIRDLISITKTNEAEVAEDTVNYCAMNKKERQEAIKKLQKQMHEAAELLDFELAAQIRDMVLELKSMD